MTLALALLALAMGLQLDVRSTCPSGDQIRAQLNRLLPAEVSPTHLAMVSRAGQELSVELRQPDGTLLAQRTLAVGHAESCNDQARAVAVLLAAWELRLKTADPSAPDLASRPGAPANLSDSTSLGGPVVPVPPLTTQPLTPVTTPPTPAATSVETTPAEPPPVPPPSETADQRTARRVTLDVGAGILASLAGGRWALGGLAELVVGDRGVPWIGVLSVTAVGRHSLALGSGTAEWSRFALNVGPGMRFHLGHFALEPYLALSPAWLHLGGVGFIDPTASNGFDLGLGGGARLSVSLDRLRPWVALGVVDWLLNPQVSAHGLDAPESLPNIEILVELGLSFDAL